MAKFYTGREPNIDARGHIQELLPQGVKRQEFGSIAYITGKRWSVRANHWHKTDYHYCVVVEGQLEYAWRGQINKTVHSMILNAGDIVFTPPGEVHRFKFITKGAFIALAHNSRTQKNYEHDTVRENV